MMKIKMLLVAVIGLLIGGCSAHNAFIITNTTDTHKISENKYNPHNDKVFISADSLPADTYDLIGIIDVGKIWYGSTTWVFESMAIRGRELGADAVIEVKTWYQPSGFSWAAPHGSGKAVKYIDKSKIDYSKLKGELL